MKPFDPEPVLAAWPTLDPPNGFAERVLAAIEERALPASAPSRPGAPEAVRRRWPIFAVAFAAVVLLTPLFAGSRHHASAEVAITTPDLDLGLSD